MLAMTWGAQRHDLPVIVMADAVKPSGLSVHALLAFIKSLRFRLDSARTKGRLRRNPKVGIPGNAAPQSGKTQE
ncbi:MAG: hypothetical protein BWY09_02096 [Candidatus Hydrogenedentes bacterium ADurb.Bin179]|nr:MAG: hypothetical protein BWY09_02096 [Candidatus Hydrogenedentes bacterium ADurb.Bin179]